MDNHADLPPLTLTPPVTNQTNLPHANPSLISLATTNTTSSDPKEKDLFTSTNPCSAFYSHPPTRTSLEQRKSESKVHIQIHEPTSSAAGSRTTLSTSRPKTPHHSNSYGAYSPTAVSPNTDPNAPPPTHLNYGNYNPNAKTGGGGMGGGMGNPMKKVSTMWPSHPSCNNKTRRESKHNLTGTIRGSRYCAPYRRMSKKQRMVFQIIIALVLIGVATALGVGISKAVGGGVWDGGDTARTIDQDE